MHKLKTIVAVWALLALVGVAAFIYALGNSVKGGDGEITSFEECVEAGNPVMESYPEQCRTEDGKLFVRDITKLYDAPELGLRFRYPENYELERRGDTVTLIEKGFEPVEAGEGPPAINMEALPGNDSLGEGERREYSEDGLYATDVVEIGHRSRTLRFSVGWIAATDQIRRDFESIIDSVELY